MRGSTKYAQFQRGVSLTGLIFLLAVLGFVGITAANVLPSFSEYRAVKNAIAMAKTNGGSVREMQLTFDKGADTGYISSISGKDLVITKDNGETEISFAYEKRIPIAGNVSLVIDYAGTTAKDGVVAKKTE